MTSERNKKGSEKREVYVKDLIFESKGESESLKNLENVSRRITTSKKRGQDVKDEGDGLPATGRSLSSDCPRLVIRTRQCVTEMMVMAGSISKVKPTKCHMGSWAGSWNRKPSEV